MSYLWPVKGNVAKNIKRGYNRNLFSCYHDKNQTQLKKTYGLRKESIELKFHVNKLARLSNKRK